MYATPAALPVMVEQGGGDIVNVSSVAGHNARSGSGVYNATKFGVGDFSEALRQEVTKTHHIRVIVVEPGAVATELPSHITNEQGRRNANQLYNTSKILESADIADAIVYAVSWPAHVSVNEVLIRPTEQER